MTADYEVFDSKIVDIIQTLIHTTKDEDEFWLGLCAITSKLLNESFTAINRIHDDYREKEKLK